MVVVELEIVAVVLGKVGVELGKVGGFVALLEKLEVEVPSFLYPKLR